MSDQNLIAGLVAAVMAQPHNVELRQHLVELLLASDRAAEALEHIETGLGLAPGTRTLLDLGAEAAARLQDSSLAQRYRMLSEVGAGDTSLAAVDELVAGTEPGPSTRWITLADVAGLADVKEQLERALLAPLRHPELRAVFAKSLRGGMLLWGPPGCGKTHLARALAGELSIDFVAMGTDEILSHWFGATERNLSALFAEARRRAPCVLFLDELDALGRRRSSLQNDTMRTTVNQLLDELDGVASRENADLFVIGATNAPWDVDAALRRPGRLDRTLFVPPPDRDARVAILGHALALRPVTTDLDLPVVAARTAGLSGADLTYVVAMATDLAFSESIEAGKVVPIAQRHLLKAAEAVPSSVTQWLGMAETAARYTDDEAMFEPFHAWHKNRRR